MRRNAHVYLISDRMKKRALLLIDVQKDFLPGGAIPTQDKGIVTVIDDLLRRNAFDLTVASQDWHPQVTCYVVSQTQRFASFYAACSDLTVMLTYCQDHISFAALHGKEPGQHIVVDGTTYQVFAQHCVQHSEGACFPIELQQHKFDRIIRKGNDKDDECFSAFASFGKRRDTGLTSYLNEQGIQQIYAAGVTLEQCVQQTVQDAITAGFETSVIVDATAPVDAAAEEGTLQELQLSGARLIRAADIPAHV